MSATFTATEGAHSRRCSGRLQCTSPADSGTDWCRSRIGQDCAPRCSRLPQHEWCTYRSGRSKSSPRTQAPSSLGAAEPSVMPTSRSRTPGPGDVDTAATRPQTRYAQIDDCSFSLRRYAQQSSSSRSCVASPDGSQQVDVDRSLVIIVGKYRAQMYMAAMIGEEAQLPWRGVRPVHDF